MNEDFDLVALRRLWATAEEKPRAIERPEQTRDVAPRVANVEAIAYLVPLRLTIKRALRGQSADAELLLERIIALVSPEAPIPKDLEEADRLLAALEDLLEAKLLMPRTGGRR